jgi:hypothetical protein
VRGLEAFRDLPADVARLVERERAALQALVERLARHELEHEEARVAHPLIATSRPSFLSLGLGVEVHLD